MEVVPVETETPILGEVSPHRPYMVRAEDLRHVEMALNSLSTYGIPNYYKAKHYEDCASVNHPKNGRPLAQDMEDAALNVGCREYIKKQRLIKLHALGRQESWDNTPTFNSRVGSPAGAESISLGNGGSEFGGFGGSDVGMVTDEDNLGNEPAAGPSGIRDTPIPRLSELPEEILGNKPAAKPSGIGDAPTLGVLPELPEECEVFGNASLVMVYKLAPMMYSEHCKGIVHLNKYNRD